MQAYLNNFNDDEASILFDALKFFCKILFHGNMLNRMTFYIQKNPELVDEQGECWPEDDANRVFVIDIRCASDDDDPCDALAHELVHCKQWATGQLAATSTIVARKKADGVVEVATSIVETWNGKIWTPGRGEHPYFDCPWEVEAYGKALGMVARWKDYQEKKRKKINGNCNYGADYIGVTIVSDDAGCIEYYGA